MSDKRVLERRGSLFYLKVLDCKTDDVIGRLIDITAEGFKLISKQDIPLKKEYNLALELPEIFDGEQQIFFNAESLHSKKDVNPEYNNTGFRFIDLSKKNLDHITRLMENYIFES